ncbi:hypothetical protein BV22DRAFT_1192965 [Leucogyrophana mollusca]|uniref:Uncharacterized protein n=1 Tax=Leucogyrophana mollusca TaxID=85980 RepID=A0ACB8BQP7_9AGAM|nr:hypothetical protein BV22DRAFT_1192965 [Leucogyrophana mollusca]
MTPVSQTLWLHLLPPAQNTFAASSRIFLVEMPPKTKSLPRNGFADPSEQVKNSNEERLGSSEGSRGEEGAMDMPPSAFAEPSEPSARGKPAGGLAKAVDAGDTEIEDVGTGETFWEMGVVAAL